GENVAGRPIDCDERSLELFLAGATQTVQAGRDGAFRRVLDGGHERRVHLPVRRMVSAELAAELLTQELLRPPGPRVVRPSERKHARTRRAGGVLLLGRDESLRTHLRE